MTNADFSLKPAVIDDAPVLAKLHTAASVHLTEKYGRGPWSSRTSEKGVLFGMRNSQVFVARLGTEIVGSLRLATKKPWAIDVSYFAPAKRPLYLIGMAIAPARQHQGLGRKCLQEVKRIARAFPADAVRLDAFDAKAGAGDFYRRCGWSETGRVSYRGAALIYYELLLPAIPRRIRVSELLPGKDK
jgi:GNAT superfamily N-acetyltransferase